MAKNDNSVSDRRRYPRVKFHGKVTAHPVVESKSGNVYEVQGNPLTLKAQNVSEGGIRLELGEVSSPSSILKLNFKVDKDRSVDVYSKLAWVMNGLCGFQFIVLDEEVRKAIRGFVERSLE
jgi:hypothetical protein